MKTSRCESPAVKTVLASAYFIAVLLPVFLTAPAWFSSEMSRFYLGTALCGFAGYAMLAFQTLLAARFRFLDRPFGLDHVMQFHKLIALAAFVLLTAHFALLAYADEVPEVLSFWTVRQLGLGKLTLAAALLISSFSAMFYAFGVDYNVWRFTHKLAIVVIILAFAYASFIAAPFKSLALDVYLGGVFILAIGLFTYRNLFVPLFLKRRYSVSEVAQETHDTYTLTLTPCDKKPLEREPGQFVFLTLLRPGLRSEVHPFSISATPARPDIVQVTVKQSGNFTDTIDRTRPGDGGLIEGPYGRFSPAHYPIESLLFIAGGVGITPIMSMMRWLRDTQDPRPAVLLYANRTRRDIIFARELAAMPGHMKVVHVLSQPDEAWQDPRGRISRELIEEHAGALLPNAHIFLCGPPPMMDSVLQMLKSLNMEKSRIHYEYFTI